MSQPSDGAMEVAREFWRLLRNDENGVIEWNSALARMIDHHTAALRREVEALRARVALLEDISADGEGLACMVQGYSTLPTRVLREAEIVLQNIKTVRSQSE